MANNWLLGIFEFMAVADIFGHIAGLSSDIAHDPTLMRNNTRIITIDYHQALDSSYNANDIVALLEQEGIEVWGKQIARDFVGAPFRGELPLLLTLCVYPRDEAQARYLLDLYGIPVK